MIDASVAALLSALGQAIGIPSLSPDAQGCCRLMFDGDYFVELHPAPAQGRWLVLCTLRAQRPEGDALQAMLQGNHLGAGFGGGWAGLDAQGCVVLHLPVAWAEATAPAMLQAMELLLQHADRWQSRLAAANSLPSFPSGGRMVDWAQRI